MTDDAIKMSIEYVPFLFYFAEPLPVTQGQTLRYDAESQLSQVLIEGKWIDTPDAPAGAVPSTRLTRVHPETTDEQ